MGNQANRVIDGLTVIGTLAIGNAGDGDYAVLQVDGSGNLYVNGVAYTGGGGGASGAASGDLTGSYPAPTIANGAVTAAKIAAGTITVNEIASSAKDAAAGTASLRSLGTTSVTAAAGNHTHAAGDITSGTVATARLGSGTANSSSFLRGDSTWAAPSTASKAPATKTVASSTASGWNADYTCDGSADNVEISSAISAMPATGGRILLSEGVFSLNGTLALTTGVCLEGQGPGTVLEVSSSWSGSNTGVITLANSSVHAVQVKNLTIRGVSRGTNVDGIYLNNSGGSFTADPNTSPDAEHLLQNLLILTMSGCGIRSTGSSTDSESAASSSSSTITTSSGNARGTWIDNVFVFFAGRNGLLWHSPDSFISNFVTGSSNRSGIVCRGGNVRYASMKSYYSAWHGVVMAGNRNEFSTIEAQDNYYNGFYITGDQTTASGLSADSNGQTSGDGYYINCSYSNIEGVTYDRAANATKQRYGITFGGGSKNNIMLVVDTTNFSGAVPNVYSGSPAGQLTLFLTTNGTTGGGDDLTQARFGAGRLYANTPTTAPADADLGASDFSFYLDESITSRPKLKVKGKKSSSSVYTADLTRQDAWLLSDEIVAPGDLPFYLVATSAPAALTIGTIYAVRCRARKTGTITGVYVYLGGTVSGNMRGGIYTTGLSASNVFDSGSVAVSTTNAWTKLGTSPAYAVTEGDYFDLVVVADNTSVLVGRNANAFAHGNVNNLHADFTALAASGGNTKMNWAYAAGAYAAFPSTLTDGNRLVSNDDIALIAKIT